MTSIFDKLPWKKDENLFIEADKYVGYKRRYENYVIFKLGEKLANIAGVDVVFRSPNEYPDAILIDLESERALNIEFEEYSSDFREHDPSKCDLIVCYFHDWKDRFPNEDCPLPVYELGYNEGIYHPKAKSS